MNKKLIWSVVVIILVAIIIVAVNISKKGPSEVYTTEPIRIGAVLSLTGFAGPWGEYGKKGIDLAVKTINDAGGINGRKVQVMIEDDHTDAKDAVSAYNKLVNVDGVQGIIGGVFDFTAQPLIPLALANNKAFISPSNFRIAGGFDLNDQSFVMLTDFNKTIRALTDYIRGTQVKKLAVVHFKSTFGNEIAKTLDSVMKENGQAGIIDEPYGAIGSNDFRTTIVKLKSEKIDAVFLDMVGADPLNFITRAKQLGLNATIIGYNGILDAFVNEKDKSLLEGVVILNWEVNSPQFTKLYQDAYAAVPAKSADKYFDAVCVLAQGIVAQGVPTATSTASVAPYIAGNTFTTPNNTIKFTTDHAVQNTPVEIDIVKGGQLVKWVK